jgi:reactive chlorine resistance protein C
MRKRIRSAGLHVMCYGLVVVLLWVGGMKFTAYEAEGIKPMVENSPLMS